MKCFLKVLYMNGHYALTDWHGGLQLWKTVVNSDNKCNAHGA